MDEELQEELQTHVEFQARKYISNGLSPEAARRRALVDFGGTEAAKEACRDVARWQFLETAVRNVKLAMRSLRKSPGFSVTAVLILAMGIGANAAVFALINALVLKPLPVERPDQLIQISSIDKQGQLQQLPSSILEPLKQVNGFAGLCGFGTLYEPVEIGGVAHSVGTEGLTGDCFSMLGTKMQLGRPLTSPDDSSGAERVVVVTDTLWRNVFGSRRDVLGKRIRIGSQVFTIVGVTEKRFRSLLVAFPPAVLIPLAQRSPVLEKEERPVFFINVLARLRGISEKQARAQIAALEKRLPTETVPPHYNVAQRKTYLSQRLTAASATTGVDYMLRNRFRKPLYTTLDICLSILLIACVSLTNLLLARGLRRRREFAGRLALGAHRRHIAELVITECCLLLLAGATIGILVALWATQALFD